MSWSPSSAGRLAAGPAQRMAWHGMDGARSRAPWRRAESLAATQLAPGVAFAGSPVFV